MSKRSEYAGRFHDQVTSIGRCFYCKEEVHPHLLEACHLIPKQRLEKATRQLDEDTRLAIIYDPRLAVAGCGQYSRYRCHGNSHHRASFQIIYLEDLPKQAIEAAAEYAHLGINLERDYPSLEELRSVV